MALLEVLIDVRHHRGTFLDIRRCVRQQYVKNQREGPQLT